MRVLAVLLICAGLFCLGQARSQVPMTGAGKGVPVVGPPALTFLSAFALTDAGVDKTSVATAIGTAFATRIIFASVVGPIGPAPNSLTIGGVSSTLVVQSSTNIYASVWQAAVPSGTTANIDLNFPSNPFSNYEISLWSADSSKMISTTATGSNQTTTAAGTTLTATLSASNKGFVIAGACSSNVTSNSAAWTGGESYTKRADVQINGCDYTFADSSLITGGASDTAVVTYTASGLVGVAAAAWR